MARGVNKVTLIGNLGQDPELRHTSSGMAVCNSSLATTDSWKDKNSGEQQERTEWHRLVFFNRLAEIVCEYLQKGSQIYVEGRLQTSKWQDQSGNDRYTTEIVVNDMQMLGGRGSGSSMGSPPKDSMESGSKPAAGMDSAGSTPDLDDDIPF